MLNESSTGDLISAVVTCYNHSLYVEEAIESLLEQRHQLLEIIVVDDGSIDDTFDRARAYMRYKVRVLRTPNSGPSHAMNFAISQARGDILLLQSGDDVSLPDRATRQLEIIRETGAEISSSVPWLIDTHGNLLADVTLPVFFALDTTASPNQIFKRLFFEDNFVCAPSAAIKRSAWNRIGKFHEGLIQLQDYDYWLRATSCGVKFAIVDERFIKYRIHSHNLSNDINRRRTSRERAFIMRTLAKIISKTMLVETLFGTTFTQLLEDFPREVILPLLYLRHSDPNIQEIGLELLLELTNSATGAKLLKDYFGIERSTVFQLLLNV